MFSLEKDINIFFENMKTILLNKNIEKCDNDCKNCKHDICLNIKNESKNIKSAIEQRTNVIYLNTNCNLRCTYCYEGNSREGVPDQADCTPEMIDEFLEEICNREKNCSSTIVIMGGEPFLKFDLINYTIVKCIQLVQHGKQMGFGISLITNGTLFNSKNLDSLKYLIDISEKNNISVNIEVSYDCSGHFKRKYPDGSSSRDIVEKSIIMLIDKKISFKISYTVHSGNNNMVIEDVIYILEKFQSDYLTRITIGYAYQELDDKLGIQNAGQKIKEYLIPYMKSIFKKYKVPICGHVCDICKICERDNFIGNSYLSPTTGITYDKKETKHKFMQF